MTETLYNILYWGTLATMFAYFVWEWFKGANGKWCWTIAGQLLALAAFRMYLDREFEALTSALVCAFWVWLALRAEKYGPGRPLREAFWK